MMDDHREDPSQERAWVSELQKRIRTSLALEDFRSKARAAGLDLRLDLCKANLPYADLRKQVLSGMNLSGADLSHARLQGCSFVGTNLAGADLTHAEYEPDQLCKADLTGTKGLPLGQDLGTSPPQDDRIDELKHARVKDVTGLLLRDLCDWFALWELGDSAVWARLVTKSGDVDTTWGRLDASRNLVEVLRSGRPDLAVRNGGTPTELWDLFLPIVVRSRIVGALQVGRRSEHGRLDDDYPAYERAARVLEALWDQGDLVALLSCLPRTLNDATETATAMLAVTETARRVTSADWAAYVIGRGDEAAPLSSIPVAGVSLSATELGEDKEIVAGARAFASHQGQTGPSADTLSSENESLSPSMRKVAARIRQGKTQFGFLVAGARRGSPFDDRDHALLESLGYQAGSTYAASQLVSYLEKIEAAIAGLGGVESLYRRVCTRIMRRGKLDFVALQMRNVSEGIIETVAGTDIADAWVGRARHPLSRLKRLRDIQADIVLEGRGEVLVGAEDSRLDQGLFKEYRHELFTRLFMPLVVFRNADDKRLRPELNKVAKWHVERSHESNASRYVLKVSAPKGVEVEVLGTIEGGLKIESNNARLLDVSHLRKLAKAVTLESLALYNGTLQHALEEILAATASMAGGDSATLHFLRKHNNRFVIEVAQGVRAAKFLYQQPPRPGGLGMRAVRERRPLARSGAELKDFNPDIWNEGIKAMAAFPLIAGVGRVGVLYVHFNEETKLSDSDLRLIGIVASEAGDAIRLATDYAETSERERLLRALQKTGESLKNVLAEFRPDPGRSLERNDLRVEGLRRRLLESVASIAANILAADVVTIHEYEGEQMKPRPVWMGRLLDQDAMGTNVGSRDVPYAVMKRTEDLLTTSNAAKDKVLQGAKKRNFVKREGIRSVAAVKLKSDGDVVGIMFVNYRRRHEFSGAERSLIQLFASSAATFIKHGRELVASPERRQEVNLDEQQLRTVGAELQPRKWTQPPVVVTGSLPSPPSVPTATEGR